MTAFGRQAQFIAAAAIGLFGPVGGIDGGFGDGVKANATQVAANKADIATLQTASNQHAAGIAKNSARIDRNGICSNGTTAILGMLLSMATLMIYVMIVKSLQLMA